MVLFVSIYVVVACGCAFRFCGSTSLMRDFSVASQLTWKTPQAPIVEVLPRAFAG